MKKVRSPKDIKIKSVNKRVTSPFVGRLNRPISSALKKLIDSGKVSGSTFGDIYLDLVKLK